MVMRRFVEALNKTPRIRYRSLDRIPGTNKSRTYVSNHSVYSRESDIKNLIRHRRFPNKSKCQIVVEHCPYEMDATMEDMDIDTYCFSGQADSGNEEPGCRGITCEECWEKEII